MFKLTFKNLGPIREAELELRPLTVIIGANNTGKTYLAYATYALLLEQIESLSSAIDRVAKPIGDDARIASPSDYGADVIKKLKPVFSVRFGDLTGFFQDTSQKLFLDCHVRGKLPLDVEALVSRAQQLLSSSGASIIPQGLSPSFRIHAAFQAAVLKAVLRPLLLPAERNAFILTYKMLANRRYRVLREGVRGLRSPKVAPRQAQLLREQNDIRYPTPIEDFLDFLSDVELSSPKPTSADAFQELAAQLARIIHEGAGGTRNWPQPKQAAETVCFVRFDRALAKTPTGVVVDDAW